MSWRETARPIIERVLRETAGQPEAAIRKALRAAYPFGPRSHHPYKQWCDEVARQRRTGKYAPSTAPLPLFDDTFICTGCQRAVPWSKGAADDGPDLCDECWAAKRGAKRGAKP